MYALVSSPQRPVSVEGRELGTIPDINIYRQERLHTFATCRFPSQFESDSAHGIGTSGRNAPNT